MEKVQKSIVTPMWSEIRTIYKVGTNDSNKYATNFEVGGKLDKLCYEFVDLRGAITTEHGWNCVVEDVKMDLWKERIWSLIENAGLLPEISWDGDKEANLTELRDKWELEDAIEEEVEVDDAEAYRN